MKKYKITLKIIATIKSNKKDSKIKAWDVVSKKFEGCVFEPRKGNVDFLEIKELKKEKKNESK